METNEKTPIKKRDIVPYPPETKPPKKAPKPDSPDDLDTNQCQCTVGECDCFDIRNNSFKAIRFMEYVSMFTIFIITGIQLIIPLFINENNPAVITDYGDNYLTWWYPLFTTIMFAIMGLFFFVKAWFFRSCIYTKIISTSFAIAQFTSLISILVLYLSPELNHYSFYKAIYHFALYVGCIGVSLIWIVRFIAYQFKDVAKE